MKNQLCLCLAILMLSCSKSSKKEIRYFPDKAFFDRNIPVEVDLDSKQITFKEISREIRKYYGSDSIPYLQLNNNGQVSKIGVYGSGYGLISERNLLEITKDSIKGCAGVPISKLDSILKVYYLNYGEDYCYSETLAKAVLDISLEPQVKSEELKKMLTTLISTFDNIQKTSQDTLKLMISIGYYESIPPPPPPKPDN